MRLRTSSLCGSFVLEPLYLNLPSFSPRAWASRQPPLQPFPASRAVTVGTSKPAAILVLCDCPNSESLPSDIYTFRQTNQAEISHAYLQLDEAIHLVALELPRRGRNWFLSLEKFCEFSEVPTGTGASLVKSETKGPAVAFGWDLCP